MGRKFIRIEKQCEYCGKQIERKKYTKKYEDTKIFMKRKYCDRNCMRKAWINVGENASSKTNSRITARKIKELFKDITKCEMCGKEGRLDVHHVDENPNNNNIDNLMCLCRSCHMKIHRPIKICSVDGCNSKVKGYGLCDKHYQRFRKTGNPLLTKYDLRKGVV